MQYVLNFLSSAPSEQTKGRIQFASFLVYTGIWILTVLSLFQFYKNQSYINKVHYNQLSAIEARMSDIEPYLLILEKKTDVRNSLLINSSLYTQEAYRPKVWYARLDEFVRTIPPDLIITRIFFNAGNNNHLKQPEITIDGYMDIKRGDQNIYNLDTLVVHLMENPTTNFSYSRIAIENNSVYKDEEELKLIFRLGYYR